MNAVSSTWVADLIRAHDQSRPRSQQVEVGPSQLGDPCDRALAYRSLRVASVHRQSDILAAWIGTAAHVSMAEALQLSDSGWQTEVEVVIPGYDIPCHIDAWHEASGTVLDWKFVGDSSLRKNLSTPSQQYITQVHLYGCALASQGHQVNTVALAFIPRNGGFHRIHMWMDAYDEAVAEAALQRWHNVNIVTKHLGAEALRAIKTSPLAYCDWCPWFNPAISEADDPLRGCPGYEQRRAISVMDVTAWGDGAIEAKG